MKNWQNENKTDRVIRFFVALVTAFIAYYTGGTARDIWVVVAAIALISSLSGFSLFYKIIGISTLKK